MNGVNFNGKKVQGFGQAATNEPGSKAPRAIPNRPGMITLTPTAGNPRYRGAALPQPPRVPGRVQTPISVCPPGYAYYKGTCFPVRSPGPVGYSSEPLPQPGQPPSQPIPQIPVPGNPGPTVPPIYPGDLRGVGQGPGAQAGGSLPFPQDAYGGGNGSLPGYDVAHAGYWQGAAAGGTPVPPGTPISARRQGVYRPSGGARAGYLHGVDQGVGAVFLNNSTSPTGWWKDNGDGTWSPADSARSARRVASVSSARHAGRRDASGDRRVRSRADSRSGSRHSWRRHAGSRSVHRTAGACRSRKWSR